ncbi:MAG: hypothetical protein A2Y10_12475 [Planctomycetes bacterium GWF2_41_51]|nr:MAG: hypothetical protein A2Y10_12475 [Planctomycetes bacterium GWF2_41_51]HBG27237.1 hypothetical protein [Phycisphaerales bacterium]
MIIGFTHRHDESGGPGSFQIRISRVLQKRGWQIVYPEDNIRPDVILVIQGSRKIGWLLKCKAKGIKIVQRLNGIHWLYKMRPYSIKMQLMFRYWNINTAFIRRYIANSIVYQSNFSYQWWQRQYGKVNKHETIIYNGVDCQEYKSVISKDAHRLICVEGNLDYNPYAAKIIAAISHNLTSAGLIEKLELYGTISNTTRELLKNSPVIFKGNVAREAMPQAYRNSVLISLDLNPSCPNSVLESLASGCPVIGFDTGALKELVSHESGKIVPYGSNPWKLEKPDIESLSKAGAEVLENHNNYSQAARRSAEINFNLDDMVDNYLKIFGN